ncbi:lymphocyte antigen 6E-like [Heteronotia binoei]|uniref:lymphocyte antigen 6E-like n=1 Tax=Heteronotia binoei TaxID=13085 RepID=UPI0029316384|nr:lymphocyte antigen 6E-like [Heteronotia binoei]
MKSKYFLAILVGASLFVEIAQSMMCFTCQEERSNWGCLRMSSCPQNAQKCLTIGSYSRIGGRIQRVITKMCAPECPTLSPYSSSVYCCDHSWCNIWSPK